MSQRPVSYAGKRIAPSRRSVPPRKAPAGPTPPPVSYKKIQAHHTTKKNVYPLLL